MISDRTLMTQEGNFGAEILASMLRDAITADHPHCVSIPAADVDGFEITLYADGTSGTFDFGGLQHDFSSLDDAILWASRAASPHYRLRIELIGEQPFEWTLEEITFGAAAPNVLRAGRPVWFRSWRSTRTIIKQNHHISS